VPTRFLASTLTLIVNGFTLDAGRIRNVNF
jgi:hypothetical protein